MTDATDTTDAERVFTAYPSAPIDPDNFAHYAGRLERRFLVNRCEECQTLHTPMRSVCPKCWSDRLAPTEVSGAGTLYLLTVLHTGMPAPGVDYATGLAVGSVELAEQAGLRVTTTIQGDDPYDLEVGTPVELVWIDGEDGAGPTPAFRPVGAAS